MKKFRGLLAMVVALAVACTGVLAVSANGFKDVPATTHSWCVNEINTMAEDGIIEGVGEGLFMPDTTVTKLQSLVLVARILGFVDKVNADLVAKAEEMYGEAIAEYNLGYGQKEICYLLLKGIIFENELSDYLANGAANEGMKRYEVAILLTKAMGAEADVKNKVTAVLDYTDITSIPTNARKYVEYVTNVGLMNGVGENSFAPLNDVTRAQAAVVLYRMNQQKGHDTFKAIVASYDASTGTIRLKMADNTDKKYKVLKASTPLRCDGYEITHEDIVVGWEAFVTVNKEDDTLAYIDFLTSQSEGSVSGKLLSKTTTSGATTLKVENITATGSETVSYKVADDVVVTYNGKEGNVAEIKTGDYVKLTIKNREISVIVAEGSTKKVKGTVVSIDFTEGVSMTVKVNDEDEVYYLDSNVKVAKNDNSASVSDILVGDKVTLTLKYNLITNIEASSTTSTDTGIIQAINISQNPTISIKIGSNVYDYPVAREAEIYLDDERGTIYDLRINSTATIKLESDSIIRLETIPVEEEADVKGEVVAVNVAYNLIQVKFTDSISGTETVENVFVKDNAKIISTSSSTDKKLKDVQIGQIITAMGSRVSGVFEATTIVIR